VGEGVSEAGTGVGEGEAGLHPIKKMRQKMRMRLAALRSTRDVRE
jgi:hypothetical protein